MVRHLERFLIDTHVLLWTLREPERLPQQAKRLLESASSNVVVSLLSLWEVAVKVNAGKLRAPNPLQHVLNMGMEILPIHARHIDALYALPLHHRDPFDRLLIAQAIVEDLPVLTADAAFSRYDVKVIW